MWIGSDCALIYVVRHAPRTYALAVRDIEKRFSELEIVSGMSKKQSHQVSLAFRFVVEEKRRVPGVDRVCHIETKSHPGLK